MRIYLGGDHGGFELKEKIKTWLTHWGYTYEDCGPLTFDPEDDYPGFTAAVAKKVATLDDPTKPWKQRPKGILICRSSGGVIIVANKFANIRAVAAHDELSAKHAREHNDANILGLSGDWTSEDVVKKIVTVWLETEFSHAQRHERRIAQIAKIEEEEHG